MHTTFRASAPISTTLERLGELEQLHLANIPVIAKNADATEIHSTFWIEAAEQPDGTGQYLQL